MNTPGSVFLVWKSDIHFLPSLKNMVACTSRMVIRDLKKHHNRIFNKYGDLSKTVLLFTFLWLKWLMLFTLAMEFIQVNLNFLFMVLTEDTTSLDFLIVQGKVYALVTYTGLMHWTKVNIDKKNLKRNSPGFLR